MKITDKNGIDRVKDQRGRFTVKTYAPDLEDRIQKHREKYSYGRGKDTSYNIYENGQQIGSEDSREEAQSWIDDMAKSDAVEEVKKRQKEYSTLFATLNNAEDKYRDAQKQLELTEGRIGALEESVTTHNHASASDLIAEERLLKDAKKRRKQLRDHLKELETEIRRTKVRMNEYENYSH